MVKICLICGKKRNPNNPAISLFSLPKGKELLKKWEESTCRQLRNPNMRICTAHFEQKYIIRCKNPRLRPDAVPTKKLGQIQYENSIRDVNTINGNKRNVPVNGKRTTTSEENKFNLDNNLSFEFVQTLTIDKNNILCESPLDADPLEEGCNILTKYYDICLPPTWAVHKLPDVTVYSSLNEGELPSVVIHKSVVLDKNLTIKICQHGEEVTIPGYDRIETTQELQNLLFLLDHTDVADDWQFGEGDSESKLDSLWPKDSPEYLHFKS